MSMELGPYSNYHDLNLDWFLNEFNNVLDEWKAMEKSFDTLQNAFNDLKSYVQDYFKNLDVQDEIDNKLDSMYKDGSLLTIIQPTISSVTTDWLQKNISNPSNPPIDTSLSVTGSASDARITGSYSDKMALGASFTKLDVSVDGSDTEIKFTVNCGTTGYLYGKHGFYSASLINNKVATYNIVSAWNGDNFLLTFRPSDKSLYVYRSSQFVPITDIIFYSCTMSSKFTVFDVPFSVVPKNVDIPLSTKNLGDNTFSIFNKVVCCGDSYTSGHIPNSSSATTTNEKYSWVKYISNITGNKFVNCGVSGANVLTWQTEKRGLPTAKTAGVSQCYIVGLGLNDAGTSKHVDIGSIDDIGTDNETYYGGYSKIIRELNEISPQSFIFCFLMPFETSTNSEYNTAILNICSKYKNNYKTYAVDLREYTEYYNFSSVANNSVSGHYTAAGYQQLAEIACKALSDCINKNYADFYDVNLIPYDD